MLEHRQDAYVERWLITGKRAPCGHLWPCGCPDINAPCCVVCPAPTCRGDLGRGMVALRALERAAAIVSLRRDGASVKGIATKVKASTRTVCRTLAASRGLAGDGAAGPLRKGHRVHGA